MVVAKDEPVIVSLKTKNPYTNMTNPNNPFRIEPSDSPGTILVTKQLTTESYPTWSRSMLRALRTKNKVGFISDTLANPTEDEAFLDSWERCNNMVVSWIQNSICLPLRSSVAFVDKAMDIWCKLRERFAQQNGPRIYELKRALNNLTQGKDTTNTYYGKLKTLQDELVVYEPIPAYSCGSLKTPTERYQRDCVIQFLMGLRDFYSNVRDQVMMIEPLPTMNKVFSYVQQQE